MVLLNYIHWFSILFLCYPKHIWTYQCHICVTKIFNYIATVDNLPSPTEEDCHIITARRGCYIHIDWLDDDTSEVHYDVDPSLPYNSILTGIERQVIVNTGTYTSRKSIGYSCRSNRTACNTIDHLKRALKSVTFPANEQIKQFDVLLFPTKHFNSSSCAQVSNTRNCPASNLVNCRQCMSIVRYADETDICKACPYEKVKRNFFVYYTTFHINMVTRSEEIRIGCQKGHGCNSIENTEEIKKNLKTILNLKTFYLSTASTTKTTGIVLSMIVFIRLAQLLDCKFGNCL